MGTLNEIDPRLVLYSMSSQTMLMQWCNVYIMYTTMGFLMPQIALNAICLRLSLVRPR